jgi:hypothetical protein
MVAGKGCQSWGGMAIAEIEEYLKIIWGRRLRERFKVFLGFVHV